MPFNVLLLGPTPSPDSTIWPWTQHTISHLSLGWRRSRIICTRKEPRWQRCWRTSDEPPKRSTTQEWITASSHQPSRGADTTAQAPASSPVASTDGHELSVSTLERFGGDPLSCGAFISNCTLLFSLLAWPFVGATDACLLIVPGVCCQAAPGVRLRIFPRCCRRWATPVMAGSAECDGLRCWLPDSGQTQRVAYGASRQHFPARPSWCSRH